MTPMRTKKETDKYPQKKPYQPILAVNPPSMNNSIKKRAVYPRISNVGEQQKQKLMQTEIKRTKEISKFSELDTQREDDTEEELEQDRLRQGEMRLD